MGNLVPFWQIKSSHEPLITGPALANCLKAFLTDVIVQPKPDNVLKHRYTLFQQIDLIRRENQEKL